MISGQYFDGKTSQSLTARILVQGQTAIVELLDENERPISSHGYAITEIKISDRLGSIPRNLMFPDGTHFQTHDNSAVDHWFKVNNWTQWLHAIEVNKKLALASVVVLAVFGYFTYTVFLPASAEVIAENVPLTWKQHFR